MKNGRIAVSVLGVLVLVASAGDVSFAASKCTSNKFKAAGKKFASKLTCHAKAVAKDLGVDSTCLAKAEVKFSTAFAKADAKTYTDAGCLTTGDADPVEAAIDQLVDEIEADLSGVRFVDNGDGTVTDNQTGLQWEQKDGLGGGANPGNPHDADNTYTLGSGDGTAYTDFLAKLNLCTSTGGPVTATFAGHCDWRLPTITELQTILDVGLCGVGVPCIDPTFGPTIEGIYWSSTIDGSDTLDAWYVDFDSGNVFVTVKGLANHVRAVRGGP